MSIYKQGIFFGISVCDISTGDFFASQIKETNNFPKLLDEIARYFPAEIVVNEMLYSISEEIVKIRERIDAYISNVEEEKFTFNMQDLSDRYKITDDKGEEIKDLSEKDFALAAVNGLLEYIKQTQKIEIEHINVIKIYSITKYMALDISARRNLELTERMRDKGKKRNSSLGIR